MTPSPIKYSWNFTDEGPTSEGLVRAGVVRWAISEQPDRDHR
jgi:hypothetical protein